MARYLWPVWHLASNRAPSAAVEGRMETSLGEAGTRRSFRRIRGRFRANNIKQSFDLVTNLAPLRMIEVLLRLRAPRPVTCKWQCEPEISSPLPGWNNDK